MIIYLDMCALKRPFDDQSQSRIALETCAVTRILHAVGRPGIAFCNLLALQFENELNPNVVRKERVRALLSRLGSYAPATAHVFERAAKLRDAGIRDMDALHLAFAEAQNATHFVTCDDELLYKAQSLSLDVTVVNPVYLLEEHNL